MNSALDKLYDDLLRQTDEEEPKEKITEAENANRFLEEKRIAVETLKEARISLRRYMSRGTLE